MFAFNEDNFNPNNIVPNMSEGVMAIPAQQSPMMNVEHMPTQVMANQSPIAVANRPFLPQMNAQIVANQPPIAVANQPFLPPMNAQVIPQRTVIQEVPVAQPLPIVEPVSLPIQDIPAQQLVPNTEIKTFSMPLSYKGQVEHPAVQQIELPSLSDLEKKVNNIDKLPPNELNTCKILINQ